MNGSTARVGWMLAAPLLLVNSAAIWGQAGWAHDHITEAGWPSWARLTVAALFAIAVESVGIFLAGMAHAALMADQSAATLRLGSYLVGGLVGTLNYWHFAGAAFRPTAQAVAFGALSSISPWLWAVYSRYRNRDRLAELGQVDKRGVKLSTSRKFWHPLKSVSVIRFASWEGVVEPDEAVKAWTAARHGRDQGPAAATMVDSMVSVPADQVARETVDPLNIAAKLDEWRTEIERWSSRAEPLPLVDPWQYSEPADQVDDQPGAIERRLSLVPAVSTDDRIREIDAAEPVFQPPEMPASDEDLLKAFSRQLLKLYQDGQLNRYQVEKLTGAARRQADRIVEILAARYYVEEQS